MDSAMRDLDQLRERDDDTRGRKLGLLTLACIVSVSALFAAGSLLGSGDAAEAASIDPLTELALAGPAPAAPALPAVRPEALSFPSTLAGAAAPDDALVEETVRAAEAEHAALSARREPTKSVSELPASRLATGDHARLSQLAKHDPLVASALPKSVSVELAPSGSEGAFTLQVVSYETRDQAEGFANALRSRDHKAFVTQAEVPGRGRFFRVRVGPFTTRREAEEYRSRFEQDEHMHTIVVNNADK
jgi:cell division septation protein DedD